MHFDLVDLRLMVHIADANSMTRGAELSFISLPAASTRSKSSCSSKKSPARRSATPLRAALAAVARSEAGSMSQATTSRAPARAAAQATTPEPVPKSSTLRPRTSSGSRMSLRASARPDAQQKIQ